MFDRLSFVIGEAFVALRRNLAMTFAGITTGAVALYLLGMLVFAIQIANNYARTVPGMFDMRVFLQKGATFNEVKQTAEHIRAIPGVASVTWFPRDKVWAKMQREQPELAKGLDNPLPDQLRVVMADLRQEDVAASVIQDMPTVDPSNGVHYLRQEQKLAIAALDTFQLLGPSLVLLLVVATGILVYNTIRLTVLSRRVEIRIMQLVGATRFVVRMPFLIEGVAQGVMAGVFAGLLLFWSHHVLSMRLGAENIQVAAFPTTQAISALAALGGTYGLLCSMVAIRAPLQYRPFPYP